MEATLRLRGSARWVVEQYPCEEVRELGEGFEVRLAIREWAWLDRLMLRLGPEGVVVVGPPGWPGVRAVAQRMIVRYLTDEQ